MLKASLKPFDRRFVDALHDELDRIDIKESVKTDRKFDFIPFEGHQSRLGHYYRHLYQTVAYIDQQLPSLPHYEYVKTVRAQLSTHEQALLLINSLTPLGNAWWEKGFILKYKLVKNLPREFFDQGEIDVGDHFPVKYFEWEKVTAEMNSDILYIVGNGFDLYHGVNCRYSEFGAYVKRTNEELHDTFERYFSFEGNWGCLEETLALLDANTIVEDASNWLVSYGSDKWRDADNHNYQSEIADVVRALTEGLRNAFTQWVLSLQLPSRATFQGQTLRLDRRAKYLNFNYTATLELLYKIPQANILYIHNRAADPNPKLILGHGADPAKRLSLNAHVDLEEQDIRVTEGNVIVDEYFSQTFKPTGDVISQNELFFANLGGTKRINVIGHSLSDVDVPYFREIVRRVGIANVEWVVTYHDAASLPVLESALDKIGIPAARRTVVPIATIVDGLT